MYRYTSCERLLDLYGECLQEEPMDIPRKFRNNKSYVTSQEELKLVRKNDLNNLQSQHEILKLTKNNLLENIANQDKILEEKLIEEKITQQVKKEILYWDFDVTKDIENVNKKWDTKILGRQNPMKMTNVFLKLRRSDAYLFIKLRYHQTLQSTIPPPNTTVNNTTAKHYSKQYQCQTLQSTIPLPNTTINNTPAKHYSQQYHRQILQSTIPTKIWKLFQTRHATLEKKLVMSKQLIKKLTKCKKTGIANR